MVLEMRYKLVLSGAYPYSADKHMWNLSYFMQMFGVGPYALQHDKIIHFLWFRINSITSYSKIEQRVILSMLVIKKKKHSATC